MAARQSGPHSGPKVPTRHRQAAVWPFCPREGSEVLPQAPEGERGSGLRLGGSVGLGAGLLRRMRTAHLHPESSAQARRRPGDSLPDFCLLQSPPRPLSLH